MPSVVSITIAKHLEDLEKEMPKEFYPAIPGTPAAAQKYKIPDSMVDSHGMVQIGGGLGFVVAPNGLILTNKHVISDSNAEYTVILSDERTFIGTVLSRDPINDVAILKIDADHLPCLELGDATKLQLGQSSSPSATRSASSATPFPSASFPDYRAPSRRSPIPTRRPRKCVALSKPTPRSILAIPAVRSSTARAGWSA